MSNISSLGSATGLADLRARIASAADHTKNRHLASAMKAHFPDLLKPEDSRDTSTLKALILKFSEKLDAVERMDEAKKNLMLRLFTVTLLSTNGLREVINVAANNGLDIGIDLPGSKTRYIYHFSDHRSLLNEMAPTTLHNDIIDIAYLAFNELGLVPEVVALFEGEEDAAAASAADPGNQPIPAQVIILPGKEMPETITTFIGNTIKPITNINRNIIDFTAFTRNMLAITITSPDFPEFVLRADELAIKEWVRTSVATLPVDKQVDVLSRVIDILIENKIVNTEGNVFEGALFMHDVISMQTAACPASLSIVTGDGSEFYVNERDACILSVNNALSILKDKCTTGGMEDTASLANTPYTLFLSILVEHMPETLEGLVLTEAMFLSQLDSKLDELRANPTENAEEISKIQVIFRLHSENPLFKIKDIRGHEASIHAVRQVDNNFTQYTVWRSAIQDTPVIREALSHLDKTSLASLFTSDIIGGSREEIAENNDLRKRSLQTELSSINELASARIASHLSAHDSGRDGLVLTDSVDLSQEVRSQQAIGLQIQIESLNQLLIQELVPLVNFSLQIEPSLLRFTLDDKFEPICDAVTQSLTRQSAQPLREFMLRFVTERAQNLTDCSDYIKELKERVATLRLSLKEIAPPLTTQIDNIPSFATPKQTPLEILRNEIEHVVRRCMAPGVSLETILETIPAEEDLAVAASAAGGGGDDVAHLVVVEIFTAIESGLDINIAAITDGILRESGQTVEFVTQRIRTVFRR